MSAAKSFARRTEKYPSRVFKALRRFLAVDSTFSLRASPGKPASIVRVHRLRPVRLARPDNYGIVPPSCGGFREIRYTAGIPQDVSRPPGRYSREVPDSGSRRVSKRSLRSFLKLAAPSCSSRPCHRRAQVLVECFTQRQTRSMKTCFHDILTYVEDLCGLRGR